MSTDSHTHLLSIKIKISRIILTFRLLYISLFCQKSLTLLNLFEENLIVVFSSDLAFHHVNVEVIEILNDDVCVSYPSFLFPF